MVRKWDWILICPLNAPQNATSSGRGRSCYQLLHWTSKSLVYKWPPGLVDVNMRNSEWLYFLRWGFFSVYTCNLFKKKIKTTHQENMGWVLTNNICNVCISMILLDSWLIYTKTFWIFSHSNGWMPWIISIKLLKNVVKMFIIHNSHKIADFFIYGNIH